MKLAILSVLPLAFCDLQLSESEASNFLKPRQRRSQSLLNSVGDGLKEAGKSVGKGFNKGLEKFDNYFVNHLDSIEAWEEWKDDLEEMSLPESEVDGLERCISKCWAKDHAKDASPFHSSFEESRETYEDMKISNLNAQRPVPCPKCCEKIPKSLGDISTKFPQISGTCNIASDDDAMMGVEGP